MMDIFEIKPYVVTPRLDDKIFIIHGKPGTGKTTVSTTFEGHLLMAFEKGYGFINNVRKADMPNWYVFRDTVRQMTMDIEKTQEYFKFAVIDTIGMAYEKCVEYVKEQNQVKALGDIPYGQGYALVRDEFKKQIDLLVSAGIGVIFIAHSAPVTVDDKEFVRIDVDKRAYQFLTGLADFILYIDKQEGQFIAYSNDDAKETKRRSSHFPDKMNFSHENLQAAMAHVAEVMSKESGISVEEAAKMDSLRAEPKVEIDINEIRKEATALATKIHTETPSKDQLLGAARSIIGGTIADCNDPKALRRYIEELHDIIER